MKKTERTSPFTPHPIIDARLFILFLLVTFQQSGSAFHASAFVSPSCARQLKHPHILGTRPLRCLSSHRPGIESFKASPTTSNIDRAADPPNATNFLATVAVATLIALSSASPALAAGDPKVFNGDYADPFHPLCERHIEVSADGKSFHYSGTAVGPKGDPVLRGCSAEEQKLYGLRKGAFDGQIIDGYRVSVGDGIHEGVWEEAGAAVSPELTGRDADGIRWNDGNKWVKLSTN